MTKKHRTTKYDTKLRGHAAGPEQEQQREAPRPRCAECDDTLGEGDCKDCRAERAKRAMPDAQTRRALARTGANRAL